jgi:GH25 family lysozyme M1 (1,4-beta-N-acetylmuramidase)
MRVTVGATILLLAAAGGCAIEVEQGEAMGAGRFLEVGENQLSLSRTCASGSTVPGIDVSYYQATIDWDRVAAAGIEYAFIRVSDGLNFNDSKFQRNWDEAKRVGVRRAVYQYFRPHQSAIAQANLLLDRMGTLEPGDLPPVIDVESDSGLSKATVAARVKQWVDHVQEATGVRPIIYTGPYFWRDQVGGPSWAGDYPLWVAHYTNGCPLTPAPWSRWSFHQYTDRGHVDGVPGNVDRNHFNGTLADLDALTVGGAGVPPPPACEELAAAGGVLDEENACVRLGGPSEYLRAVDDSGAHDGDYVWTGTTGSAFSVSTAEWTLRVPADGVWDVDAHVPAGAASSKLARYVVQHADGDSDVVIDQSAAEGFVSLGSYRFTAGTSFRVTLADNTGEPSSLGRRVVFDGLRVQPTVDVSPPDDGVFEPPVTTPDDCRFGSGGGVIEEDGACVTLGGPTEYLRAVDGAGHGGAYVWTGATASSQAANFAEWTIGFVDAGVFAVEAYAPAGATSQQARYSIDHGAGTDEVVVNQGGTGFKALGVFRFDPSGGRARLADNTGESSSLDRRIGIDALRLSPASGCQQVRVDAGSLNVRPAPSTSNDPVGQVRDGDVLAWVASVEGQSVSGERTWYRVSGAMSGYLSAKYADCE